LFQNYTRKRVADSGWGIHQEWDEVKWDKARYAVGLRELAVFQFEYQETSEIVSIPFHTPKPISTVVLEVDERIPESFPGPKRQWLRYYFSLNDGQTWYPIEPLRSRLVPEGAERIPTTYRVNSGVPKEQRDPRVGYISFDGTQSPTVRFKAALSRPAGSPSETPLLQSYRLVLTPRDPLAG